MVYGLKKTKKVQGKRYCYILAVMMIVMLLGVDIRPVSAAEKAEGVTGEFYYAQQYENAVRPEEEISIDLTHFVSSVLDGAEVYENREGSAQGVAIADETCEVTFVADVAETRLYNLEMTYYTLGNDIATILFGIKIDGKTPYTEANTCVLNRVFRNEEIRQDKYGNDIRPLAVQTPEWTTAFLTEQTGVAGTLSFYLEKGQHEITLCFDETPLLIEAMKFKQKPSEPSYQDYMLQCRQNGYEEVSGVSKNFQAEKYLKQSDSELWPGYDRSSDLTQPFDYNTKKINYGGGSQWDSPGQWISWTIEVPEDGLYNIGIKYRQSYLDGLFSSREISIDGEVPFAELKAVRFPYTSTWENLVLGNEDGAYSVYLTKGEHVITMKNVLGDMGRTIDVLQTVVTNLNELYLSVVMITGESPDQYRDYYLDETLPDLAKLLLENSQMLFQESENLIKIVGGKGEASAFLEDIAYNLETYADDVDAFSYDGKLGDYKNDIVSLSSKLSEYRNQALDIDYFTLISSELDMPSVSLQVI